MELDMDKTRLPLIAGNWKMNTTADEAVDLVTAMLEDLDRVDNIEKVVCPPFVALPGVSRILKGRSVKLGAQNVYYEEKGAYTGEVSPLMLTGLCEYVIIGHSERRQYFNEDGEIINRKIKAALKAGLKPILCVGERLAENEAGKTREVVASQLESALAAIGDPDGLVIAYEPVWAIGTGKAATGRQADETIAFIRGVVAGLNGAAAAGRVRILYGGSVTAANTAEFMEQPGIDGALVGGASLKAPEFINIVKQTSAIRAKL